MKTIQAPRLQPPVVTAIAGGVQLLIPARGPRGTATRLVATALGVLGMALPLASIRNFGKANTTIHPHHPEQASELVTTGINGLTRNPMYLGMCTVLVAHAVWRGSPWALLPAAGTWLWLDRLQVPAEEQALGTLFGERYAAYRRRVPRWIGPLRAAR